jgi:hypothetical protein
MQLWKEFRSIFPTFNDRILSSNPTTLSLFNDEYWHFLFNVCSAYVDRRLVLAQAEVYIVFLYYQLLRMTNREFHYH